MNMVFNAYNLQLPLFCPAPLESVYDGLAQNDITPDEECLHLFSNLLVSVPLAQYCREPIIKKKVIY